MSEVPSVVALTPAFLKRPNRGPSPLAGPPLSPGSKQKRQLASGHRWRFTHQAAPTVQVTRFEERQPTTEYVIETRFGDGPAVVSSHRFSDFIRLHEAIGTGGTFPVAKALFVTEPVKQARVVELGRYLSEVVEARVVAWASEVSQGLREVHSDVLSTELQDFLRARDLDRSRLDSLRSPSPAASQATTPCLSAIPAMQLNSTEAPLELTEVPL